MCGIVGYISTETNLRASTRARYMAQGLVVDTLRGEDSTGAFFVPHNLKENGHPGWCKDVVDGYTFVNSNKYFTDFLGDGSDHYAVIGHNRAGTRGGITLEAAHPFREDPITLVHNGTLHRTNNLPITQAMGKCANDSHTIAKNLVDTPIGELTPQLDGSYALIWHDQRDGTVNIVREPNRPLHIAKIKGQDTLLIASEAEMLYWLCSRLKMVIEDLATPAPYQHLKFVQGSIVPEVTEVERYKTFYPKSQAGNNKWNKDTDPYGDLAEGDYVPINPVSRKATGRAPLPPKFSALNNKVKLLGRSREVPKIGQEQLKELGLEVRNRLTFLPVSAMGFDGGKYLVSGWLEDSEGITAIIHGIPQAVANVAMERRWVVRPIGVKYMDTKEPAVICKVVSTDSASARAKQALRTSKPTAKSSPQNDEESSPLVLVPGQSKQDLSPKQFERLTSSGCVQCSGTIGLEDADEMVWVNDGRDPMCPTCVKDWFDQTEVKNA